MKNRIIIMLLFALLLLTAGCAAKKKNSTDAGQPVPEYDYVIGVMGDNEPYYYTDETGKASGFYANLMESLAQEIGFTYTFWEVAPSQAPDLLEEGSMDAFLGTYESQPGETGHIRQTRSFYRSELSLITSRKSGVKKAKELRGSEIAAIADTEEENCAKKMAVRYEASCISLIGGKEALSDMEAGYSKAVLIDKNRLSALQEKGDVFRVLKTAQNSHNRHRFTLREDASLMHDLQKVLKQWDGDGTIKKFIDDNL